MDRRTATITVIVSALLHLAVLSYVVTTWGIVPTLLAEPVEKVLAVAPPPPPPPPPPPVVEPLVVEKPRFRPRAVPPPPVPVKKVQPLPLKPQPPAKSTADATQILSTKPAVEGPSDKEITDHPLSKPPGKYPQRALDEQKEGVVKLRITIQPDGSVNNAEVVSAAPPGWFETAAVATVKRWRYKAAGRVITADVEVTYKLE
jgi:protein TonB